MRTFRDAVGANDFTVVGQLRLYQDSSREEVLRQAERLSSVVDAVAVTDCPYGVVHMSGLAAAAILMQHGMDAVLHLSARDRNRIALQSELLGAAALGVTSLLLQRGDKLPSSAQPPATQVFDTGAKKLLATAKRVSDHQAAQGKPELFLGTMATVFEPPKGWQPTELTEKIGAGAQFVQTQACLNLELLRRYMRVLVAAQVTWRCHVMVSLPVLTSAESARWLFGNARGDVVPEGLAQQFEDAKDAQSFGVRLCAEMIRALRETPGVGGVNLSTTGEADAIVAAVNQARG